MSDKVVEGGCFCGAVRIRTEGEPLAVVYCHCNDCRRWSGAPVSVFVGYPAGRFEMERDVSRAYESSPGVRRTFCGECGTALLYEDERLPGEVYVAVGAFDDPERFEPEAHSWASKRLSWLHIEDGLPRYEKSSRPR